MPQKNRLATVQSILAAFVLSASAQQETGRVFAVRTARPQVRTVAVKLVQTGSLSAPATVALCAKVPGRLAAAALEDGTPVSEGTRVEAGRTVARIDDREYRAARDAAAAAVAAARAEADSAAREFARTEKLRDAAAATEQEFDAALFARDRSAAALAQALAALEKAELDLAETEVRAPMDGAVSAQFLWPGAMVSATSPIFEIVACDPLRVLLDVPTTSLPALAPGKTRIRIFVDAWPDEPVDLVVAEAYPTADPGTRTVTVKALLPNPDGRYMPGMFAKGELALDEREGVTTVPFEAVLRIVDRTCVYKVEGGRAVLSDVETGIRHDEALEIVSGVSPDDEIVVEGLHRLSDGVAVRVVE